jgi:phosphogluconate dehydratase
MDVHPTLAEVTARIRERSRETRAAYLDRLDQAKTQWPARSRLSCTNLAHAFAAFAPPDKDVLRAARWPNIGIVSAYNDMLSAHQPLQRFPEIIKQAARESGAVAQFAGGVPAMCDGVTQGQPGMELSLFSRDVIALATTVSLSHNTFDAALCLGICDKIVPGLLIGALKFGHLPTILVPGGPMPSGLPNQDKAKVRQLYAQGKVGRDALLETESQAYHAPGTCTFYGTANSNQMLMEVMGLHMPGAAFVNPNTPLRDALTHRRPAGAAAHGPRRNLYAGRPGGGRTRHRQRHRRTARHRRVDQPHHSSGGDRAGCRHPHQLGRLQRSVGGRAADCENLSERRRRRERFPSRRRHGIPRH